MVCKRLEFLTTFGEIFAISATQRKAGRKLVTRFKNCMYDTALNSSTPAEVQEERSVVSGLAEAFMRKHVGEEHFIEQLAALHDKREAEQLAAIGVHLDIHPIAANRHQ